MRLGVVLLRKIGPANKTGRGLWQDPVLGYWETHGKTEFLPGEQYDMSQKEKQAVLERYRMKEVLKKEYHRLEYDPIHSKYREGVVMDPSVFRWYAADLTQVEHFRYTPKTAFMYIGSLFGIAFLLIKLMGGDFVRQEVAHRDGDILWWDRDTQRKVTFSATHGILDDLGVN